MPECSKVAEVSRVYKGKRLYGKYCSVHKKYIYGRGAVSFGPKVAFKVTAIDTPEAALEATQSLKRLDTYGCGCPRGEKVLCVKHGRY